MPLYFPRTSEKNAQVRALVKEFSLDETVEIGENFGTCMAGLSTQMLAYLLCKRPFWTVVWDYLTKHPSRDRVPIFILIRLLGKPPGFKYREFVSGVAKGMIFIEKTLSHGGPFIAGEYSAADVLLAQGFPPMEITAFHKVLESDQFPNIKQYWPRLQQRESYKAGILDYEEDEWSECKARIIWGGRKPRYRVFLVRG